MSTNKKRGKKEKFLLTRKTWRYMRECGKFNLPQSLSHPTDPQNLEDVENYFQQVCLEQDDYIVVTDSGEPSEVTDNKTTTNPRCHSYTDFRVQPPPLPMPAAITSDSPFFLQSPSRLQRLGAGQLTTDEAEEADQELESPPHASSAFMKGAEYQYDPKEYHGSSGSYGFQEIYDNPVNTYREQVWTGDHSLSHIPTQYTLSPRNYTRLRFPSSALSKSYSAPSTPLLLSGKTYGSRSPECLDAELVYGQYVHRLGQAVSEEREVELPTNMTSVEVQTVPPEEVEPPPEKVQEISDDEKSLKKSEKRHSEGLSESTLETIKRYLKLVRGSKKDTGDKFKKVNYDRNLRNIKPKYAFDGISDDTETSKATQVDLPVKDSGDLRKLSSETSSEKSGTQVAEHCLVSVSDDHHRSRVMPVRDPDSSTRSSVETPFEDDVFHPQCSPLISSPERYSTPCSAPATPMTSPTSPTSPSPFGYPLSGHGPPGAGPSYTQQRLHSSRGSSTHSYFLSHPTVMQKSKQSGSPASGSSSRPTSKKLWRTRSKSQSRANSASTCTWTPLGQCRWSSVTGKDITLSDTTLMSLSEVERITVQQLALAKLQALNLGCQINIPKEEDVITCGKRKRKPYLMKKKALSTGIFESYRKEDQREAELASRDTCRVFGVPLRRCVENDLRRYRNGSPLQEVGLTAEEGQPRIGRKNSRTSWGSFNVNEIRKYFQSTTSTESLNIGLETRSGVLSGSTGRLDAISMGSADGVFLPDNDAMLEIQPIPKVPHIVNVCLRHLETYGLHTLGLFRVSASKKRARQLQEEFDSAKDVKLNEQHCPHDVGAMLKEYLRELPQPLFSSELYQAFISTQKIRNRRLQFEALQHLVQLLPVPNRDTLNVLLNFLNLVAENAEDKRTKCGEIIPGNKMDSSNLATVFAPNILHTVEAHKTIDAAQEAVAHAEDRIDVINVVRGMIDHNKELFEVPADLLDEVFLHLMDKHPAALDVLLRKKAGFSEEIEVDLDTSSSLFEGSECNVKEVRDVHRNDRRTKRTGSEEFVTVTHSGSPNVPETVRKSKRSTDLNQESGGEVIRSRRHRSDNETEKPKRKEKPCKSEEEDSGGGPGGWFRKRDKSRSREGSEEHQWWFRRGRNDKNERRRSRTHGSEAQAAIHEALKHQQESTSGPRKSSSESHILNEGLLGRTHPLQVKSHSEISDKDRSCSEQSVSRQRTSPEQSVTRQRSSSDQIVGESPTEGLSRRLSTPSIDNSGVITASLKIPVPLSKQALGMNDNDIPFIEDGEAADSQGELTQRSSGDKKYQAAGSVKVWQKSIPSSKESSDPHDLYMGQAVTGAMSFTPIQKSNGGRFSHDSAVSTGSSTEFGSAQNTASSDFLCVSGTSSPLSSLSPPMSPESVSGGVYTFDPTSEMQGMSLSEKHPIALSKSQTQPVLPARKSSKKTLSSKERKVSGNESKEQVGNKLPKIAKTASDISLSMCPKAGDDLPGASPRVKYKKSVTSDSLGQDNKKSLAKSSPSVSSRTKTSRTHSLSDEAPNPPNVDSKTSNPSSSVSSKNYKLDPSIMSVFTAKNTPCVVNVNPNESPNKPQPPARCKTIDFQAVSSTKKAKPIATSQSCAQVPSVSAAKAGPVSERPENQRRDSTTSTGSSGTWKRWEIIASDPNSQETFV